MASNNNAAERTVPNSELKSSTAIQRIGIQSHSTNNSIRQKKFQERGDTTKMGEHPSLSSPANASSGPSSRLNSSVGSNTKLTKAFNGNAYLSNKKTNSAQDARNLHQFVKKPIPQARHDQQSSHQPIIPMKVNQMIPLNQSLGNSLDSNNIKVKSNTVEAPLISTTFDSNKQMKQGGRTRNNQFTSNVVTGEAVTKEIAFQPRIVSSGNVKGMTTSNGHAMNEKSAMPLTTHVHNKPMPKLGLNGQVPLKVPYNAITSFTNPLLSNPMNMQKQIPVSIPTDVSRTNQKGNIILKNLDKSKVMINNNHPIVNSIAKVALQKTPSIPIGPVQEKPLTEEEKMRIKLMNAYGPYFSPSDTSLIAARDRLRQALSQTRDLRAAFSDRVYNKYRILLRPVPKTVDEIIDSIRENPKVAKAKIEEKIKLIKKEKDAEKKEIPKRAAMISNSLLNGEQIFGVSSSASAMNIAESEQLFSAGLSLVILPEGDIDENEINLDEYEHRGPTDPETGQRLGGISSAAAAAAEALLDRTRRGIASRLERRRRNMVSSMEGDKIGNVASSLGNFPLKQFSTSSSEFRKSELNVEKALGLPQSFLKPKPGKVIPVVLQKSNSKRQVSTKSSGSTSTSTWNNKRRVSKSLSVGNVHSLLSLSANVEGKKKAAALAIHSLCPSLPSSGGRSSSQHSLRSKLNQHPHPESKGGIAQMAQMGSSSSRKSSFIATSSNNLMLPRLMYPRKRKRTHTPKLIIPYDTAMKPEAIEAVGKILNQFYYVCSLPVSNKEKKGPKENNSGLVSDEKQLSRKRRRVTEIGMLRALRSIESTAMDSNILPPISNGNNVKIKSVNPVIAFSVLQALGIFAGSEAKASPFLTKNFHVSEAKTPTSIALTDTKKLVRPITSEETINLSDETFSYAIFQQWKEMRKSKEISQNHQNESKIKKSNEIPLKQGLKTEESKSSEIQHLKLNTSIKNDKKALIKSQQPQHNLPNHNNSLIKLAVPKKEGASETKISTELNKTVETKTKNSNQKIKENATSAISKVSQKSKQSLNSDKKHVKQSRAWESLGNRRTDIPHHSQQPQQQQLATQHHTPSQILSHMQAPGMQHNYSVLSQAGNVTAPFGSSPQRPNRMGMNPIDQRLNHSNAHMLNNHHRNAHLNPVAYGDALNHNAAQSLHFHGNAHLHHSQQNRAYGAATDWPSLGLLSASPTMIGGIDLSTTQAHAMIGHSAQAQAQAQALMVREQQRQHFAAAVRSNLNNIASLSAQQANMLLNNGRVPNGNAYQQQRLQQYGGRTPMQATDEVSMMASAGLLMTGQRPLRESFPALSPNQSQSLMYLAAAKDSSAHFMKRPASAGSQSDLNKVKIPVTRPASAENSSIPSKVSGKKVVVPKTESKSNHDTSVRKGQKQGIPNKVPKPESNVKQKEPIVDANKTKQAKVISNSPKPVQANIEEKVRMQKSSVNNSVVDKKPITGGMQFFVPPLPSGLSKEASEWIVKGCVHKLHVNEDKSKALEYVISVGAAVPIPKALVSNPLKERINLFGKSSGNMSSVPKEVVAAAISTWLWHEHCDCFQRAFAKSGRIDVDPECKWLITMAIDSSLRSILMSMNTKTKGTGRDMKYEFLVASLVCETLTREMYIDESIDTASKNVKSLISLLDQRRLQALKLLCQERVLIATLVSRHIKMTEQFSNAYVSSMVRAGEAIGHEELFDIVQDESTSSSTLLPHDILSDTTGNWDDPCRSVTGFSDNLDSNDLTIRAHARAQLHKSTYKLQDKFDIKGGVSAIGPYSDSVSNENTGSSSSRQGSSQPSTPRGGILRRRSSGATMDSGSSAAFTSRFNPLHYSLPLLWDNLAIENMPYGRFASGTKKGKRPNGGQGQHSRFKKPRLATSFTKENGDSSFKVRSTEAVDWADVAKFFKPVTVKAAPAVQEKKIVPVTNIFAPIFNEIPTSLEVSGAGWSDSDNSDDEDISKEAILLRHQVVLDDMKMKLDVALDAQKKDKKK